MRHLAGKRHGGKPPHASAVQGLELDDHQRQVVAGAAAVYVYGVYHASLVICRMLRVFRSLANRRHREYEPLVEYFIRIRWRRIL